MLSDHIARDIWHEIGPEANGRVARSEHAQRHFRRFAQPSSFPRKAPDAGGGPVFSLSLLREKTDRVASESGIGNCGIRANWRFWWHATDSNPAKNPVFSSWFPKRISLLRSNRRILLTCHWIESHSYWIGSSSKNRVQLKGEWHSSLSRSFSLLPVENRVRDLARMRQRPLRLLLRRPPLVPAILLSQPLLHLVIFTCSETVSFSRGRFIWSLLFGNSYFSQWPKRVNIAKKIDEKDKNSSNHYNWSPKSVSEKALTKYPPHHFLEYLPKVCWVRTLFLPRTLKL